MYNGRSDIIASLKCSVVDTKSWKKRCECKTWRNESCAWIWAKVPIKSGEVKKLIKERVLLQHLSSSWRLWMERCQLGTTLYTYSLLKSQTKRLISAKHNLTHFEWRPSKEWKYFFSWMILVETHRLQVSEKSIRKNVNFDQSFVRWKKSQKFILTLGSVKKSIRKGLCILQGWSGA